DQLSAGGAASIAPHAEATPPPVVVPEALPLPPVPPPVDIITDRAALAALIADIEAVGAVAISPLFDGPSSVRSDLVGLAFAAGERRAYLPLCHRYLGAPACLPEAEALAALAPVLANPAL